MRVEINSELESGNPTLEIPWAGPRLSRQKYVDLRKFPERIASLVECRHHPPLARLLQRLNLPGSIYRTAKCDVWITRKLEDDEKVDFGFQLKVGSYVDLVFERNDLQSRLETHVRLAQMLERSMADCPFLARMEIVVRRCLFHKNDRWGYSLTLFLHAYGATKSNARREWEGALDCLGEALLSLAPTFMKKRGKRLDPQTRGAV
jgi:hypothetical protein